MVLHIFSLFLPVQQLSNLVHEMLKLNILYWDWIKKIHYFVDTTERGDRSLQRHPKDRVGNMEEWTEKLCPQNSAPAVSLGENGDKQFCKEKFHAANGKAQHALVNGPIFFFLRGQGEMDFFFSLLVPNVFPSCSQRVKKVFLKMFPIAPVLYPMWFGLGEVQPHVDKLKRWNLGEHICFYFAIEGPKRCFYWGHGQWS